MTKETNNLSTDLSLRLEIKSSPQEEILAVGAEYELVAEDSGDIDCVDNGDGQSPEDRYFDLVVGKLMDILISDEFEDKQTTFFRENCRHFEDTEENKLIYMDLFKEYTSLIETHLEARLAAEVPDFDLEHFYELISTREACLMGDVFEMLLSLTDFDTFKELMLSYKQEQQNGAPIKVDVRPVALCADEQGDGEHRPDLDAHLIVSPVSGRQG